MCFTSFISSSQYASGETEVKGDIEIGLTEELKFRGNYSLSFQFTDCLREPVVPNSQPGIIIIVLICYAIVGFGVVCTFPFLTSLMIFENTPIASSVNDHCTVCV